MKFYFIVSSPENAPGKVLLNKLKPLGKVIVMQHVGKLSGLRELQDDKDEKILALFPVAFNWDLDVETIKKIPRVKAVCISSTSFDWVKPKKLRQMGIPACNTPGFANDSVAEYALSMAIETARGVPLMIKNNWKYHFDNNHTIILKGKTAGIIGLGRVGTRMAELCQGIGMEVVYWSRKSRNKRFKYIELDKLFKTSDLIMPALVESEETKKLITRRRLDLMKKKAIMVGINRVRALWDEKYILKKVRNEEIFGYAMEGESVKSVFNYKGNVWPLPAMIWFTDDSLKKFKEIWVENVINASLGKYSNQINNYDK